MKVKLKVLTPLHIGSGEKYSALEYILENGVLKKYSLEKIINKAKEGKLLEPLASYFKRETFHSLREICDSNSVLREAILELKPEYTIKAEIKREVTVEEFIKTNGKIYIPGSEIKGSIRRALLFYILKKDERLFERFLNMLRKADGKEELETVSERIENIAFRGGKRNAQYDILKLLKVSDTELAQPSEKNMMVKIITLFYATSQSWKKQKLIFSEVVLPGTQFEFNIDLSPGARKLADVLDCHPIIKSVFLDSNDENATIRKIIELWKEAEKECIKLDPYLIPPEVKNSEMARRMQNQPVVRIGKHEGYLFTTVMALVKERDEKTFEKVFKLSVPKVSGIPNKTRKLTMKEKLPLGFCSVESI
jgi:CRISPR-associated protein Csm5